MLIANPNCISKTMKEFLIDRMSEFNAIVSKFEFSFNDPITTNPITTSSNR